MLKDSLTVVHLNHAWIPPEDRGPDESEWGELRFVGAIRYDLATQSMTERMVVHVRSDTQVAGETDWLPTAGDALMQLASFLGDELLVSTQGARETCRLLRRHARDHDLSYRRTMWLDLPSLIKRVFRRPKSVRSLGVAFGLLNRNYLNRDLRIPPEHHLQIAGGVTLRLLDLLSEIENPLTDLYFGGVPAAEKSGVVRFA